jgi:hypothetical protein
MICATWESNFCATSFGPVALHNVNGFQIYTMKSPKKKKKCKERKKFRGFICLVEPIGEPSNLVMNRPSYCTDSIVLAQLFYQCILMYCFRRFLVNLSRSKYDLYFSTGHRKLFQCCEVQLRHKRLIARLDFGKWRG